MLAIRTSLDISLKSTSYILLYEFIAQHQQQIGPSVIVSRIMCNVERYHLLR